MTSRVRLLAPVLLVALGFACGKTEEQAAVAPHPASAMSGEAATEAPAGASSPSAATATTPLPPARTAAPAASDSAPAPEGRTLQATPAQAPAAAPPAPQVSPPPAAATAAAVPAPEPPPPPAAAPAVPPPPAEADEPPVTLPAGQRPKGKITLPAKLGAVTFDHEKHAGEREIACTTCHHPSRPEKPLVSESQACRDCHAMPAAPPMKTSLRAAFHDPKAATGTCVDCHEQKGDSAPVKCLECHKRD